MIYRHRLFDNIQMVKIFILPAEIIPENKLPLTDQYVSGSCDHKGMDAVNKPEKAFSGKHNRCSKSGRNHRYCIDSAYSENVRQKKETDALTIRDLCRCADNGILRGNPCHESQ